MKTNLTYISPALSLTDIENEGILCSSPGNEGVTEEEGNGDFS